MAETAIWTIETLLEGALKEADDPDVTYKLRQALSLLHLIDAQQVDPRAALNEVGLDPDLKANLREFGISNTETRHLICIDYLVNQ
jgi:hypothetical protein